MGSDTYLTYQNCTFTILGEVISIKGSDLTLVYVNMYMKHPNNSDSRDIYTFFSRSMNNPRINIINSEYLITIDPPKLFKGGNGTNIVMVSPILGYDYSN